MMESEETDSTEADIKMDSLDLSCLTNYMSNNFVSLITFEGTPILPPLMTKQRKEEMLSYKRQACIAETRINARRRELTINEAKSLLAQTQVNPNASHIPIVRGTRKTSNRPEVSGPQDVPINRPEVSGPQHVPQGDGQPHRDINLPGTVMQSTENHKESQGTIASNTGQKGGRVSSNSSSQKSSSRTVSSGSKDKQGSAAGVSSDTTVVSRRDGKQASDLSSFAQEKRSSNAVKPRSESGPSAASTVAKDSSNPGPSSNKSNKGFPSVVPVTGPAQGSSGNEVPNLDNDQASSGNKVPNLDNDQASSGNKVPNLDNDQGSSGNEVPNLDNDQASSGNKVPNLDNDQASSGNKVPNLDNDQGSSGNEVPNLDNDQASSSRTVSGSVSEKIADDRTSTSAHQADALASTSNTLSSQSLLIESMGGSLHLTGGLSSLEEQGIPSFLQSLEDYQSLDDGGSLPTEYDGMPLTSNKEKQISQALARLSRVLNRKTSPESTLNSEDSSTIADIPSLAVSTVLSTDGDQGEITLGESSSVKESTMVEDTINQSSSTFKSNTLGNISIDERSIDTRSNDSIRSPKSPKNTVHFASTVTEFYTDQSSGHTSALQKSLHSPASTPRVSDTGLAISKTSETLLQNLKARRKEKLAAASSNPDSSTETSYKSHISGQDENKTNLESGSFLSKVSLSPEMESSSSFSKEVLSTVGQSNVPFQSYGVEGETSDKENECLQLNVISDPQVLPEVIKTDHNHNSPDMKNWLQKNKSSNITELRPAKSKEECLKSVSRPGSQLSKVSLHSLSTDTDTLCDAESIKSTQNSHDIILLRKESNRKESQEDIQRQPFNIPVEKSVSGETVKDRVRHKDEGIKKHTRKGSYTLEVPSPALVRACSKQNVNEGRVLQHEDTKTANLPEQKGPSAKVQKKLDYSELDEEPTRGSPVTQVELEAERRGKEEHLNRYLDCVQRQSEENGQRFHQDSQSNLPLVPSSHISNGDLLTSIAPSSLSNFSFDQSKLSHMSQEEVFDLQVSHFDLLRKQLVEEQKAQLEQLFQQQQQQQLLLQKEIEEHCRQISQKQNQQSVTNSREETNKPTVQKKTIPPRKRSVENHPSLNSTNSYSYVTSPSLTKHPSDKDTSFVSTFSRSTPKQYLFCVPSTPPQASNHALPNKPVMRSPRQLQQARASSRTVTYPERIHHTDMQRCFNRVSAMVKGYLTRRLLRTEKVQNLIKTVQDTRDFAVNFQHETPIKQGRLSLQDQKLLDRIIAQLQAALLDIHEVFFEISTFERMAMISASRQLGMERRFKDVEQHVDRSHPRVSMATLKAMERKRRSQAAEASVFGTTRPQSAPPPETSSPKTARSMDLRALRPIQGQISPIQSNQDSAHNRDPSERPKTAPDRVTVGHTYRIMKAKKSNPHTAHADPRRHTRTLLVKAKPSNPTNTTTAAQGTTGAGAPSTSKVPGRSKSGKAWR